jgi:hypothetical protein
VINSIFGRAASASISNFVTGLRELSIVNLTDTLTS